MTPCHCTLLRDLRVKARQHTVDVNLFVDSYLALVLLYINLISQHYEGEVLWVMWTRLDEELVPPAV